MCSNKTGRGLSAWLGLVPRQNSSGSKERLGGITKAGEPEVWFEPRNAARVDVITERLLGQRKGYAMLLLNVELSDD